MTALPGAGRPLDLRLVPAATALWLGAFAALSSWWRAGLVGCAAVLVVAALAVVRLRDDGLRRAVAVAAMCVIAGFAVGAARAVPVRTGPVAELAGAGAYVEVEGVVAEDPQRRHAAATPGWAGDDAGYVVVRVRVDRVTGRGSSHRVRTPVLVVAGDAAWASVLPGQRVRAGGRLEPTRRPADDVAAVLRPRAGPGTVGGPGLVARATEPFRAGLRGSVAGVGEDARGLVPGLVVGDESLLSDDLRDDMRTTGLSHLTAVSGTNVTIVLVVVLGAARWAGVRGYGIPAAGVVCVLAFVLLARPDPSVLRAGAMGVVAVVGLMVAGRRRGLSALAAAVCVLVLVDPWLARSVGFVLSVCATAGILLLVPRWQAVMGWVPRSVAAAVAVPLAAQVACAPVIVAASGELSLASLPANMLVAPVVAPATVLGLLAAVVSPVVPGVAAVFGWLAGVPAWWIAAVARWFADQPGAATRWPGGAAGTVAALLLAGVAVVVAPLVLRRPLVSLVAAAVLALGLFRAAPTPGWPPPDWVVVACDVGQGDALALRVAEHTAVVVDTGRDPPPVRRCLDTLDIRHVPLLVLSHFHADHVGGVPGVLAGRDVGRALVSPLAEPAGNAAVARTWLDDAGVPVDVARAGERRRVGERLTIRVVWPRRVIAAPGSASNNASVVLDATVDGVELLLTGDLEPPAQRALLRAEPDLATDVLKVAHHGSADQEEALLTGVGADVALISVGENDYGHPSRHVLRSLRASGVSTLRTDEDGSVAVVRTGADGLGIVRRGSRGPPVRGRSRPIRWPQVTRSGRRTSRAHPTHRHRNERNPGA
ncbi:competence protein ComEC [Haloactinopolyspora alba]|uniref:Competence protein ComEC n=1 Tax=Haloactinopolyspora alba TaxID=648780 RepID=A0A2P8EBR8_9ACTN|nr:ComEC/Rec2 family competence protein [Haloactinopolyspora alba]PSL06903.1 competence protein ComEC [Haloactinopolyspora alba]